MVMKRYQLCQEFSINDEQGNLIKNMSLHAFISAENISETKVCNMFSEMVCNVVGVVEDNREIDRGFEELNERFMNESECGMYGNQ